MSQTQSLIIAGTTYSCVANYEGSGVEISTSHDKISIESHELEADGALQLRTNKAVSPHRRLSHLAMMSD